MKRFLFILVGGLWFIVCGLVPAFAQDFPSDNHLVLPESGKVSVLTIQTNPPCDGQLFLYQPYEKLISTSLMPPEEKWIEVGYFNAGDELVFKVELNGASSSCTGTILSTNTDFGYLLHTPGSNLWFFVESSYFVMGILFEPAVPPPLHHPAIFIHGLGGRPEDWVNGDKKVYFDTLKADPYNYSNDYLVVYPYADADNNPATYDYQGDVTKISADLGNYVNELSQKYLTDGGDGKVDLVGFSLGGLVARQYLNTHPTDHKIRKVITIASPHEGAYILSAERWFDLIPFAGDYLKKAFNVFMENTLLGFMNFLDESGQPTDLDSVAIQQIVPGSNFLATINSLFWTTPEPEYEALYGDIDAEFRQKIFFFTLKKKFSVGDGFIKTESATGIPAEVVGEYGYSDPAVLNIKTAQTSSGAYEYVLDTPSISDLSVWHGKLIVKPDVVQKVIELLTTGE